MKETNSVRLKTILPAAVLLASALLLFGVRSAQASDGSFATNVIYSVNSAIGPFADASIISLYQGDVVTLQFRNTWNFSSGCWPGAAEPTCSPPAPAAGANTTAIFKQDACPAGASCYWFSRDAGNPLQMTWGIVSNFQYTNTIVIGNTDKLAPGTYPITFTTQEHPTACQQSGGACIPGKTRTIYLKVLGPAPKPLIELSSAAASFSGYSGGSAPAGSAIAIKNSGTGPLDWTASADQNWCHIGAASGSLAAGKTVSLPVWVDAPSNVGTFNCNISISDPRAANSPRVLVVTYRVDAAVATFSLSAANISFSGVSGGSAPTAQIVTLRNSGNGIMNWTASTNQAWCALSPAAGTLAPGSSARVTVSVSAPSNVGTFNCVISFSAPSSSNSPKTLSVAYTVTDIPRPIFSVSPASFPFYAFSGDLAPSAQSMTVRNAGNAVLSWRASISRNWCRVSPSAGTVPAGTSAPVLVTVDAPSNVGDFSCVITLSDANAANNPQAVTVTYKVSPGSVGSPGSLSAVPAGCGVIALSWKAGKNATGYNVYRSTVNSMPGVPFVSAISGTSYGDTSVVPGAAYYYWVASSGGGAAVPASSNSIGGATVGTCTADLSSSDKNIKAVNGVTQPYSDCDRNSFQGVPRNRTLKDGDTLTFAINICNLTGTTDATGVIVTDKLTNLSQPPAGFKAELDGVPLTYVSGSASSAGQYAFVPGTNLVTFNIGSVPKGAARQITYDVVIKTLGSQSGGCVRCQNLASISYKKGSGGESGSVDLYTPPIFYTENKNY